MSPARSPVVEMSHLTQAAVAAATDPDAAPLLGPELGDDVDVPPSSESVQVAIEKSAAYEKDTDTLGAAAGGCCSRFLSKLKEAYNPVKNLKDLFGAPRSEGLTILDGIRAIGIIWVIGSHTWWVLAWNFWGDADYTTLGDSYLMRGIRNGDVAVDMFFVLSGFLIAHILISEYDKTGSLSVVRFYVRRYLRIMPAYGLVLAVFWVAQYFVNPLGCDDCNFCHYFGWSNLLFVNNMASPFFMTCMIWTWSIAVEVQFYLVSPFIVWLLVKRERLGYALCAFLIVLCIFLRGLLSYLYGYYLHNEPDNSYSDVIYNKVWTRMSPYVMGIVIAYLNKRYFAKRKESPQPLRYQILWVVGLLLALFGLSAEVFFGHGYMGPFDPSARLFFIAFHRTFYGLCTVYLICGALVVKACDGVIIHGIMRAYRWVMGLRFIYVFATMSYTMYLIHVIFITGMVIYRHPLVISFGLFVEYWVESVVASFILSLPLHLFVEKPWMNMRW